MTTALPPFDRYDLWNKAISTAVFSRDQAGRPVYIDLEEDLLATIRDKAEPEAKDPEQALVETIKATLDLSGPTKVFKQHLVRLREWQLTEMLDPPPVLALLTLLSLAAENMHQDSDIAANNFYGRLAEMLGLTESETGRFQTAYRDADGGIPTSTKLWDSLNFWLEMNEGEIGIPTAKQFGVHLHIGWPLSQALVRQADRDKLYDMFINERLPAGGNISKSDMSSMIADWLSHTPCPAGSHFQEMWNSSVDMRTQISTIACRELEEWDGRGPDGASVEGGQRFAEIKISAEIKKLPKLELYLSPMLKISPGKQGSEIFSLVNGEVTDKSNTIKMSSEWMRFEKQFRPEQLLGSKISFCQCGKHEAGSAHSPIESAANDIIILEKDDELGKYVECLKAQIDADHILIFKDYLCDAVIDLLENYARIGFKKLMPEDLRGLPSGWVLLSDVRITEPIPVDHPLIEIVGVLKVLISSSQSGVKYVYGFKLPGQLEKWHKDQLPEVCVRSDQGSAIFAEITPKASESEESNPATITRENDDGVLIWDLAENPLIGGDYDFVVWSGKDKKQLIHTKRLRIRSADHPMVLKLDVIPVAHDQDNPMFGFITGRSVLSSAFSCCPTPSGPLVETTKKILLDWPRINRGLPSQISPSATEENLYPPPPDIDSKIDIADQETKQCEYKAAFHPYGPCSHICPGREITLPPQLLRPETPDITPIPKFRPSDFSPIREDKSITPKTMFDALCYLGSGNSYSFEKVANEREPDPIFRDRFSRELEVLGHIEVERSPLDLSRGDWSINDPCLLGLLDGRMVLTGFRSDSLIEAVERLVSSLGGKLAFEEFDSAPDAILISGITEEDGKQVMKEIESTISRPARLCPNAAETLISRLKPLSSIKNNLPVIPSLFDASYEKWSCETFSWEDSSNIDSIGGFRIKGNIVRYVYRDQDDIENNRVKLGDARIVKYLAALSSGISLIGYNETEKFIYVPIGADLPGLYGRSAVFSSGMVPSENKKDWLLQYSDISSNLAARLFTLLMS